MKTQGIRQGYLSSQLYSMRASKMGAEPEWIDLRLKNDKLLGEKVLIGFMLIADEDLPASRILLKRTYTSG